MERTLSPDFEDQLSMEEIPDGEGVLDECADTGLGTTYERWALNRLLTRLHGEYGFDHVLEGPGDGMTGIPGINSLVLGLLGAQVTLLLPNRQQATAAQYAWSLQALELSLTLKDNWQSGRLPFRENEFDLVWNFNVMAQQANPVDLIIEMARVSSRYVLVFVPNRLNYAFGLHRLHHWVSGEAWDHGGIGWMHPQPWQRLFPGAGLRVLETFWVDCPWWPDIVDLSKLLSDFLPVLKRKPLNRLLSGTRPADRMRWRPGELPYYRPESNPQLHRQMEDLSYFETSKRIWLKQRFAHHFGILGVKDKGEQR